MGKSRLSFASAESAAVESGVVDVGDSESCFELISMGTIFEGVGGAADDLESGEDMFMSGRCNAPQLVKFDASDEKSGAKSDRVETSVVRTRLRDHPQATGP